MAKLLFVLVSAPIFSIHGFTQVRVSVCASSSSFRIITSSESLTKTKKTLPSLSMSPIEIHEKMDSDRNSSGGIPGLTMVEGYDYVHPNIAKLLTLPSNGRNHSSSNYDVDPDTFLLKKVNNKQISELSPSDMMPISQLVSLADQCEHVVFCREAYMQRLKSTGKRDSTILGLICLSQLPTSLWPNSSQYLDSLLKQCPKAADFDNNPATLVASMIALNLLESSIRELVLDCNDHKSPGSNRKSSSKNGNDDNNITKNRSNGQNSTSFSQSRKKGAPLLRDLIEELSFLSFTNESGRKRPKSSTEPKTSVSPTSKSDVVSANDLSPILRALLLPHKGSGGLKTPEGPNSMYANTKEELLQSSEENNSCDDTNNTIGGINLRNLVSHGFLSQLDRRWLALTLVLIQTLDYWRDFEYCGEGDRALQSKKQDLTSSEASPMLEDRISFLRKYGPMAKEVHRGENILKSNGFDSRMKSLELQSLKKRAIASPNDPDCKSKDISFVPHSHSNLLRFILNILCPTLKRNFSHQFEENHLPIPSLTAIFITAYSSLLEHSLRLLWCVANDRPDDSMARPSTYYVTLDGHGQRDRHDVMISPYLQDVAEMNRMIPIVGAPACALLSDLFAAPSEEAPNIRSAVSHGLWDHEILKELEGLALWSNGADVSKSSSITNQSLVDAASSLMSSLDMISSQISGTPVGTTSLYRPVFSYTAMTTRYLHETLSRLKELQTLVFNDPDIKDCIQQSNVLDDLQILLRTELNLIETLTNSIPSELEDLYSEHKLNIVLSSCGASSKLLLDISRYLRKYLGAIEDRTAILSTTCPSNTKERRAIKSMMRTCGVANVAFDLYSFATFVALLAVKDAMGPMGQSSTSSTEDANIDEQFNQNILSDSIDYLKAVERTRMALSTFDSYVLVNLDRSLKAIHQYLKGKEIKKLLARKAQS